MGFGYRVPQGHWASRIAPYTPPWMMTGGLFATAALAHNQWGTDPTALPWAAAGLAVGGVVLTGVSWLAASTRSTITRAHATLTTALAAGWLTATTITGPMAHPLVDAYLIGGAAAALSWNIRKLLRNTGSEGGGEGGLFEKVGLAKTKIRGEIAVHPNKVVAPLQLPPGELTTDDVQARRTHLAGAMDLPANAVRVQRNPDSEARPDLVIVPQDMLKKPSSWPGPSAPGASIAEPIVVGVYEDGEPAQFWLPGDKAAARNLAHLGITGISGAGKSVGAKNALAEILTRTDVVVWAADPAKGTQTLGPVLPGLDWVELTPEGARRMAGVLPGVIRARADELGKRGHDEWVPGCGIPLLVAWFEEAAELARDNKTFVDIAQKARSAGVVLVLSIQRMSYNNISTDARAQLGNIWCFGVKDIDDAAFVLSDELIEAGANPAAWKANKPGYAYLEAPGIDEDRKVTPMRTYSVTNEQIEQVVTAFAPYRAQLDPLTTAAAGEAYATRHRNAGTVSPITPTTAGPRAWDEGELSDEDDRNPIPLPPDPEPDLDGDEDTEFDDNEPTVDLPQRKPSSAEAQRLFQQALDQLRAAGHTEIGPRDIPESFTTAVRSRSWVSRQMDQLAVGGDLIETDVEGVYRFPQMHAA